jgi:hypothetical protein
MCMIDDCEPCDITNTETRVARKCHRCTECGMAIHPRETYTHSTSLMDGHWDTYKTCAECQQGVAWLFEQCGGTLYGGVYEDLREHWFGEGIRVLSLGRLIVSMRRRIDMARWMRGSELAHTNSS